MKGKIIVIEGIDGSGKNTQSNLILERLSKAGVKSEKISFPAYDETFFGKEVGNYLNGKFGGLDDVNPKLAAMLYAGDRFEKKDYINEKLSEGYILIIDRYVPSNIAHQASKLDNIERDVLADWINQLEYYVYKMPKPDLVIFLDVPPKTSQELVLTKDKRNYTEKKQDLHEENSNYLEKVYRYFRELSSINGWTHINCFPNNRMLGKEEINEILFNKIEKIIEDQ
ncbi:dTMP kinase [Marinobacterium stanieri]|uniref:dTMP kinase n=1 Tax=Marinobacterium stanieri TaxID=49186 RepID=UPI000255A3B1|nr:dTMP kinase [Marinobacterium stanieri]